MIYCRYIVFHIIQSSQVAAAKVVDRLPTLRDMILVRYVPGFNLGSDDAFLDSRKGYDKPATIALKQQAASAISLSTQQTIVISSTL
mmetsp:Transcript_24068/g.39822  ORF Transcript_24068/g.39822 Transcript_24068/m.39822 type:complete len:87 (+) Transcript_24068:453-713(+)